MSYAKHFLSIRDLRKERIVGLIADAENFSKHVGDYPAVLESKLLASAFFEPSLRTQLSFEAAMVRLGGKVLGMGSPNGSRANSAHEESLADSAKVVSGYADVIVFRHSAPGALKLYTEYSSVPVINAGNGNGPDSEHPSQALCDLYTIKKHFGKIDGLTVALLGSLQKRAIRSLIHALSQFRDITIVYPRSTSVELLEVDQRCLEASSHHIQIAETVEDAIKTCDVIYHGGLSADWQPQLGEEYFLTAQRLRCARKDAIVLHPLPRPGSISTDVDSTAHAKYFDCAKHGVAIRMALLNTLLTQPESRACQ